jgi:hypothetical protein
MSRWHMCLAMVVWLASSCYSPSILSGGFLCKSNEPNMCPDHFYCVDGKCVDHIDVDLSSPPDLSGPDLAKPACAASGEYCRRDHDCCGNYCIYRTNQCR